VLLCATSVAVLGGLVAWAQQPRQPEQPGAQPQPGQRPGERMQPGERTMDRPGTQHDKIGRKLSPTRWQKASDLMSKTVRDSQGNDLDKLQNLVVDPESGRIIFAMLSGDKIDKDGQLLAVPWSALKLAPNAEHLTIAMTKDQLKTAPAFGENSWPNLTDPTFLSRAYAFYNQRPWWEGGEPRPREAGHEEHGEPGR
jgi:sporulation protein YlmC with PRC-barrel domain